MSNLIGLNVQPDGWAKFSWSDLQEGNDYSDSSFAGCEYRLPSQGSDAKYAVNISITGRKSHDVGSYGSPWFKTRIKIEFVGDGDPSEFDGGWIYSPEALV